MVHSDTAKKKVLLTGAAGKVGTLITPSLQDKYDLCLTDIRKPANLPDCVFHQADITDYNAFRPLCSGIHTIVHLAAVADENSPWEPLLQNNIIGLYNVFEAAADAGCRRMIFASSVYAVDGYPEDTVVYPDMPVRPLTLYGTAKAFGESLCSFFADRRNLPTICLRLGWVLAGNHYHMNKNNRSLNSIITCDDAIRLFIAAIDAPEKLRFGIFHGLSNNRCKRLDIRDAMNILDYKPRDDAYELAESSSTKNRSRRLSDITIPRLANYFKKRLFHG